MEKLSFSMHGIRREEREGSRFLLVVVLLLISMYLLVSPFSVADGIGPWLDQDYGVLTDTHLRVFKGERLYEDINVSYPPATSYFIALLFRIFGDNLRTLRVTLALTGAVTACLAFYFARRLTSVSCALAVTGIVFLLGPVCVNYPYPNWFCIPLGLCMVLSEHLGWKKRLIAYYLLAGVIAGTIFSLKENWGMFALAALICTQSFEGLMSRTDDSHAPVAAGKASALLVSSFGSISVLSLLLIRGHLSFQNIVLFSLPALAVTVAGIGLLVVRLREGHSVSVRLFPMTCSLVGFAVVVLPWVIYFLIQLGADDFYRVLIYPLRAYARQIFLPLPGPTAAAWLLVLLASYQGIMILRGRVTVFIRAVFLLILWAFVLLLAYKMIPFIKEGVLSEKSGDYDKWAFGLASYVPLAVHIGLAFIIVKDLRTPEVADHNHLHLLLSLWIYSVATFHVLYPLMEIYHFICNMAPVIVLGGILIFRSLEMWQTNPDRALWAFCQRAVKFCSVLIIPLFLALFLGLPILNFFVKVNISPFRLRIPEFSDIDSRRGGVLMPKSRATSISAVVRFVESHTGSDEHIFDMTGSFFYFLTNRKNPTPWQAFYVGFLSPQDIEKIKQDLETLGIRMVVTSTVADWWLSSTYPDLYRHIHTRYKPAKLFGKYAVLVLREEKAPGYEGMDDGEDPSGLNAP